MTEEKQVIGVDYKGPTPIAFCGKLKWNIKPNAHTKKYVDTVLKISQKFTAADEKMRTKGGSQIEWLNMLNDSSKEILELTLENFSYTKAANSAEAGPAVLNHLAVEVKNFLLEGGALGMQHSRMLLSSMNTTLQNAGKR